MFKPQDYIRPKDSPAYVNLSLHMEGDFLRRFDTARGEINRSKFAKACIEFAIANMEGEKA